ncbi:MAG: hypothetical protein A2848_00505 [Candidatus Magasanikbacteria bacterium RIFCSPHIGHO2_01_FULL_50_8]|uniref:Short-chain dehydrogenase n=1 Tax=Candidatus Magasanikbacteria bacterium RIFCSPHIGHO2_01_FULL_50_8 TaxID=1798674 RepID=A0A1F6LTS6_9BACT|nr:MAG: hypothetical protein A2848_00505 [Candidatus Magasanikbacteria bacterium RIFCSPHIGHO2_01_FULL_50_8]
MKTVLITGASRGIGRALTEKFLSEGHSVIGTSRSGNAEYSHENLSMIQLELSDATSRQNCVESVAQLCKKIDLFINNAGVWNAKDDTPQIDVAVLHETFTINVYGPIDLMEKLLTANLITEQIINISSRKGSLGYTKECLYPCYSISKAALNMYTRQLAARYPNLIVSSVHPGFVKTDMNEGDGELTTAEVAADIFALVEKKVESGQFWYKVEKFPW